MICEVCKQREATVHITKIINGNKHEINMCETCAKQNEGFNLTGQIEFGSPFSFQNILSGIMEYVNQPSQVARNSKLSCENCGTTYEDFKRTGRLGCSECYERFSNTLTPIIKRVQGNIEHVGKIPKKSGKDIMEKKRLLKLKEDLQKAITAEEYEKAAEIRDLIRSLQSGE